ncbi:MAG: RNA polymerase sigma factor region1.1 domain-containing protein, partial [Nitrosospira sp.]
MGKAKTQVKLTPKSKTAASAAATLGQPADKVRMVGKKNANDIIKKSPRGSAKAEPVKATAEALEDKITAVAKSTAKAPVRVADIARVVMSVKEPNLLTAKIAKAKAIKEGKAHAKDVEKPPLAPQDIEARRMRLKNLIVQGKERGYLTYAEINDHLPDDMLDAEQIENIISMINDVGISVYDEAPDAETLLMSETAPTVADEDVVEEAEAALSTVDSEFGRTTDPVRMYMREMGSVELLTRESEIEIAKRIEDGLKHMIQAISACPTTIAGILELANKVTRDEMRIDELVDGLLDPNAQEMVGEEISDESLEQELGAENAEDEDIAAIASANLLKLKNDALERFSVIQQAYT